MAARHQPLCCAGRRLSTVENADRQFTDIGSQALNLGDQCTGQLGWCWRTRSGRPSTRPVCWTPSVPTRKRRAALGRTPTRPVLRTELSASGVFTYGGVIPARCVVEASNPDLTLFAPATRAVPAADANSLEGNPDGTGCGASGGPGSGSPCATGRSAHGPPLVAADVCRTGFVLRRSPLRNVMWPSCPRFRRLSGRGGHLPC